MLTENVEERSGIRKGGLISSSGLEAREGKLEIGELKGRAGRQA